MPKRRDARLPLLCAVRQGVSSGRAVARLPMLPGQRRQPRAWTARRSRTSREYGLEQWLGELAEELRKKTYRPQAVRRVYIPKPDGKQTTVGNSDDQGSCRADGGDGGLGADLRGRLAAGAICLPPGRSALDAVEQVQALLTSGHTEVIDADLSGYFDSIPHAELMKSVARRVSDRHLWR